MSNTFIYSSIILFNKFLLSTIYVQDTVLSAENNLYLYERALVAESCPTLCDPTDDSSPGSSVQGILQAVTLQWVAIPFSRGSSWPRPSLSMNANLRFLHSLADRDSLPSEPPGEVNEQTFLKETTDENAVNNKTN